MKPVQTFTVVPSLPPALARLAELAHNLRWTWDQDTTALFRRLEPDLWESTGHNPVLLLGTVEQSRLVEVAADEGFLTQLEHVCESFDEYMTAHRTWFSRVHGGGRTGDSLEATAPLVAYFSAEFGLADCLSIFAGGLGLLAGDHLKSASDLGVPLVGIGLLYQQGYFRQYLNEAGWQQEAYETNDFHILPLAPVRQPDVSRLAVQLAFPTGVASIQVWRAQVGRVPLYLLDTNVPENQPAERDITDQLYGGDAELRIRQELVLGIGGYRVLAAMGLEPAVCHMNEGHAAFLALERIQQLMRRHGVSYAEAREAAAAGLLFTTHTPVAAGHDYFPPELAERYLGPVARELGLSAAELLALGRVRPADGSESFCPTVLALRLANHSNAVSRLHGRVTRRMWQALWPGVPEDEVPVGHVTNGVHIASWLSAEVGQLYERYLGPGWQAEPSDAAAWQRMARVPGEELWTARCRGREHLVTFARQRLRRQLLRRAAPPSDVEAADEVLDPEALTIGFARRFATYKRATLLFRDPDRLARILNDPHRPVQLLFAGKAHPRDDAGKELIRRVVEVARQDAFRRRIVFIEDYDTNVARYLVQGADVWLNTPRRPQEASGTSGMKAAANGGLNVSVLDGWWDEAWPMLEAQPVQAGWAIGRGESYADAEVQDQVEAAALYHLLEQEVVPAFYDRGPDGLPRRWLAAMKASVASLCHRYNTHRVVEEYVQRFYLPEAAAFQRLTAAGLAHARGLATWRARIQTAWPQLGLRVEAAALPELPVGGELCVRAQVRLGGLTPRDVRVELYEGLVSPVGDITEAQLTPMQPLGPDGPAGSQGTSGTSGAADTPGVWAYEAHAVPVRRSGTHGLTARVLPTHPDLPGSSLPGLVVWATAE